MSEINTPNLFLALATILRSDVIRHENTCERTLAVIADARAELAESYLMRALDAEEDALEVCEHTTCVYYNKPGCPGGHTMIEAS